MQPFPVPDMDDINLNQPMRKGKAKGWGMEYHWVSLAVDQNKPYNHEEVIEWCKNQFGKQGARWFEKQGKFYFRSEQDMTMFILRWS